MNIVNYHVKNFNDGYEKKTTRTSIERNDTILVNTDEYKIQIKNYNVNMKLPLISLDDTYSIGLQLFGGSSTTTYFFPVSVAPETIESYSELKNLINEALGIVFTNIKAANPSFSGTLQPLISTDDDGSFVFLIPENFQTSPFLLNVFFSSKLGNLFNFGFTTENQTIAFQNQVVYKLVTNPFDRQLSFGGNSFFAYLDHSNKKSCTDIDSILFVAHSVSVNGTLEHEQKRIETRIIKSINVNAHDITSGIITVNKTTNDYYQMISHYPLSRIDIELYMRKKNGDIIPIDFNPNESFSCDIEFIR